MHTRTIFVTMWEKILNINIDEWDWYNSYVDCISWTVSTKLRSFYYQLRSADIMTNHKLVTMRIKTDASCHWCSCKDQRMLHLFWECDIVHDIWEQLSLWIT